MLRAYVVSIAVVALAVFLGFRQWSLEQRIDRLTHALGDSRSEASPASLAAPARSTSVAVRGDSHAERLNALEASLASVRADVRSLEKATADMPQVEPVSDQQILSVVKEQGAKFMENQLKYHRERWLDQREVALNDFARRFGLSQQQSDQVWRLLESEIDKMIGIMSKPENFESPERFVTDWKRLLVETDSGVHRVLDPQKAAAWDQARFVERKLLWSWLPD